MNTAGVVVEFINDVVSVQGRPFAVDSENCTKIVEYGMFVAEYPINRK
jgi:hypothetical protein